MRLESVIKRDGRVTKFNEGKILEAVNKANSSVDYKNRLQQGDNEKVCAAVIEDIKNVLKIELPRVEEIQDKVEEVLIKFGYLEIAKAYIIYRAERTKNREMGGGLIKVLEDLTFSETKDTDLKRENANIDGDTSMGTMLRYGSEASKYFNHLYLLDKEASEAHKSGDIHIHDLDFYALTMTCVQLDLSKLFANGFGTGHGMLREPNDIMSYSALACIAIQSSQNDMHGGQSIPALDHYLAPGVLKTFRKRLKINLIKGIEIKFDLELDKATDIIETILSGVGEIESINMVGEQVIYISYCIVAAIHRLNGEAPNLQVVGKLVKNMINTSELETDKQTYQAMEAMIHNFNTMQSRAGSQVPFSSVNYGTDTSPEGRMVIKNLLLSTLKGLGGGETPIFPIQIFKIKDGVSLNEGDPNYDLFQLACKVSSKRLFPNFSFLDAPYNLQYYKEGDVDTEVAYMGCRTRVMANTHDKSKQTVSGRGNLSFTSINLPRIALEVGKGNIEEFYNRLEMQLDLVRRQLTKRMKLQGKKKIKNYPFLMGQGVWKDSELLMDDETIEEVIKHGTLSIGFIGLAEALKMLTGRHHGEDGESQKLGLDIVGFMREYVDEVSEATQLNYTLIGTPAEGLSGRFVNIDKVKYGVIEGVTDKEYYTNSFHVPVSYDIKMFKKIDIEAPYHALTNAGHISYVELDGDISNNPSAFEKLIQYMAKSGMGYGSINHPVDRDTVCGFTGIIDDECPSCGRIEGENGPGFERIRRITGYLVGTLDRFNDAKKAEVRDRVKHNN